MKTSYGPRHDNFSTDHLVDIFADQFLGGISVQVEAFVVIFFFLACVLCHRRLAPHLFSVFVFPVFIFCGCYATGFTLPASSTRMLGEARPYPTSSQLHPLVPSGCVFSHLTPDSKLSSPSYWRGFSARPERKYSNLSIPKDT